jgi:hypothetical protein
MLNFRKDIKKFLQDAYNHPVGKEAQRLEVLSSFLNGMLKKGTSDLADIARQMPIKTEFESRVKQLTTWLDSPHNSWYTRYLPCFDYILTHITLSKAELVFTIDGTDIADSCTALMISVVYQKRSIPVCWVVRKGKKGHLPQSMHLELLNILHDVITTHPNMKEKKVILLGDGEFDGGELTQACKGWGWLFVVRTAHNILITKDDTSFKFNDIKEIIQDDDGHFWAFLPDIYYTEQLFGQVNAVFWQSKKYKDPLYLITNFDLAFDAYDYYKKRFAIETLFGDLKSRGFNAHKSKLADPKMVARLLIVLCLAFLITLSVALAKNAEKIKHLVTSKDRQILSIFKFGRCVWEFCLNNAISISLSLSMNSVILLI